MAEALKAADFNTSESTGEVPVIEKIMHELKFRKLEVAHIQTITPHMIRMVVKGDDLEGFTSLSPDDHVKLFLKKGEETYKRDYTPRYYDADKKELTLDFVVHEGGPATEFALTAKPGDILEMGGPKGSRRISGNIKNWILIGDETALPAIGRRIEELSGDETATSIVLIPDPQDQQIFESKAQHEHYWIHRPVNQSDRFADVTQTLNLIEFMPNTFFWIAGESSMVKGVKAYLRDERGVSKDWIKASGYWKMGEMND